MPFDKLKASGSFSDLGGGDSSFPLTLTLSPGERGLWAGVSSVALPHWIPACAGKTVRGGVASGVGEAVLDKVFCCFEAVVEFGVCVLSLHGVHEEAGDVFTVFSETDDVLLELCWDAHESLSVFSSQLSVM